MKANKAEEAKRRVISDSSASKRQRRGNNPDEAAGGTGSMQVDTGRAPTPQSGSQLATGHVCQHCAHMTSNQLAYDGSTEDQPRVSAGLVPPTLEVTGAQQERESNRPAEWHAAPPVALKRTMSTPAPLDHHTGATYPGSTYADPHVQESLQGSFLAIATVARYLRYGTRRRIHSSARRPASNWSSRIKLLSKNGRGEMAYYSANRFMLDWHEMHGLPAGQNVCGNQKCGRVESRCQEFRCCSACTLVPYCSRSCQAADWKSGHKRVCMHLAGLAQDNLTLPPGQVMQLFLLQAILFPV